MFRVDAKILAGSSGVRMLETIDDYLYLEDEDDPPPNLQTDRELN